MNNVQIKKCPVDGENGEVVFSQVKDAFFGTPGEWSYRRQPKSGHLWLDPRPNESAIASLYVNYYTHTSAVRAIGPSLYESASAFALHRRLGYRLTHVVPVISKVISYLPSVGPSAEMEVLKIPAKRKGRVLDVGCGDGAFLRRMKAAGWTVVGIEPDAKAAARLEAQDGFPVYTSLEELTLHIKVAFDLVVLSHVIEHLIDPVASLVDLRSRLTAKGEILLATPNAKSLGAYIFRSAWRGLEPPRHFNIFTCHSLTHALNRAGYKVQLMTTESRMARGIWYLSYLARQGRANLERNHEDRHFFLKLSGYFFQVFESVLLTFAPWSGEEIYCCAALSQPMNQGDVN